MKFPAIFYPLPQHETLRRLVWMRAIALSAQVLGIGVAQFWMDIALPLAPMLAVLLLLVTVTGWTWWRMQQAKPVSDVALFIQLLVDVLALSGLLYLSGGTTNPFVSFYLPALAVAAAILPWHYSLALTLCSLGCYSLLNSMYIPLQVQDTEMAINYHLTGMWANFVLSAALITWFVTRMSQAVRERDAQLALAREQHLQNERIVALGTQAASAAHAMGTPLSTVAVIAEDLRREIQNNAALAPYLDDVTTIEAQIALCKASLDRMRMQVDRETTAPAMNVLLAEWLQQFIEAWRLRCPTARLELRFQSAEVRIGNPQVLEQILLTLLDNAAQAVSGTDTPIVVALTVEEKNAFIRIIDRGPGIAPGLLKRLGYEQVQSTSGGQGIGLMLAFAAARQIGAAIDIASRQHAGTTASLTAPLA